MDKTFVYAALLGDEGLAPVETRGPLVLRDAPPEGLLRRPGDRAAVIGRGEVLRVVEAIELRTLFGSCRALLSPRWRLLGG